MKRINSIKLHNYGAFYNGGYDKIELPKGENLLIYGENGSGKSSIYKALLNFFRSAEETTLPFNLNKRLPNEPGYVEISFLEIDEETRTESVFKYSSDGTSDNTQPFIIQANRLKGFLSYHQLVRTYSVETSAGSNPDLYAVLIEELLGHHKLPISDIHLHERWAALKVGLDKRDARTSAFNEAVADLPAFTEDVKLLVEEILGKVNEYLNSFFELRITVSIEHLNITIQPNTYNPIKNFRLNVSVSGQQFDGYHSHLNEARLSALAICFYLASIKINPMADEYKILFLDDIFIGLDTANRLPLLKILEEEFKTFQVFIATYDRNWFETAKHWFTEFASTRWLNIELFADDHLIAFEKPLLFKGKTNLEKAEEYFLKKDYPAAANSLRRGCEEVIKRILPIEYQYESDLDTGISIPLKKTETLYNNLITFLKTLKCNTKFLEEFRFFQKNIFNPLSHSDIITPHYRMEISKAIDFIRELQKIKCVVLVSASGDSYGTLKLDIPNAKTGKLNHYEFFCLDSVYAIKIGDDPVKISDSRCHVYHKEENQKYYHTEAKSQTVFGCIEQIQFYLGYEKPYTLDTYKELKFRNGRSLNEKLSFG